MKSEAGNSNQPAGLRVPFLMLWLCSLLLTGNLFFAVITWGDKWGATSHEKGFAPAPPPPAASTPPTVPTPTAPAPVFK